MFRSTKSCIQVIFTYLWLYTSPRQIWAVFLIGWKTRPKKNWNMPCEILRISQRPRREGGIAGNWSAWYQVRFTDKSIWTGVRTWNLRYYPDSSALRNCYHRKRLPHTGFLAVVCQWTDGRREARNRNPRSPQTWWRIRQRADHDG